MKRMMFLTMILFSLSLFPVSAGAVTYGIDGAHSSVDFSVTHMVISTVKGNFKEFQGSFAYDDKDFKNWKFEGSIKSASINTGVEKRDDHLRSADFFDATKYPDITFVSKSVVKKGDGYVARGDFTMHGVTKEIEIPFAVKGPITDPWGNSRMGLEASLSLNRQDYGVSWSQKLDSGGLVVSDEVKIDLHIEFVAQK